jgi:hypothetical protein
MGTAELSIRRNPIHLLRSVPALQATIRCFDGWSGRSLASCLLMRPFSQLLAMMVSANLVPL